jgi:deoxyribonucleoside regulator
VLLGKGRSEEDVRGGMGVLAARLLDRDMTDGTILGISYGRSLASTVAALDPVRRARITVVPIIGALGSENSRIDGPELTRRIAHTYGGDFRYLPVPLLVEDLRVRNALLQSPQIYDVLSLARRADMVLLGIGALAPEATSLIWAGYLNARELERVRESGAVGHMVGQFFDAEGQLLDSDINDRAVGIGLKALPNIATVVAVAGGESKAEAILGALRGHYMNVLVTDDKAAESVLALSSDA